MIIIIIIIIKTFIPIMERGKKALSSALNTPYMCNYINMIQTSKYNSSVNDMNK